MKEEQRAAMRMLKRAQALGLVTKSGTPVVVDQMEELLAAAAGFRNRHAWRASLKEARYPVEPDIEQVKQLKLEVLAEIGVEVIDDLDCPDVWIWTAPTAESDKTFGSEDEALEDAWNSVARDVCSKEGMSRETWDAQPLVAQRALIRALYDE